MNLKIDLYDLILVAAAAAFITSMCFVIGFGIYNHHSGAESKMPTDFNLSETREVVQNNMPGNCINVRNDTFNNRYVFECHTTNENYTFYVEAFVEYNSTGPDKVKIFD